MTRPHGYFLMNHYTHKKGEVAGVGEGQFLRDAEKYTSIYGEDHVSVQEGSAYGNWYADIYIELYTYLKRIENKNRYDDTSAERLRELAERNDNIEQVGKSKFRIDDEILEIVGNRVERADG